jgi:ubiquitin carboxyl-terminal hydrolase 5/13
LQPGEELLPEDSDKTGSRPSFTPNPEAMAQLEAMGFPTVRCEKALYHTGNVNAEDAMNWLFGHMDDADIDEPLKLEGRTDDDAPSASPEQVEMLTGMGFNTQQAKKALKSTENNVERAVEWLFSHPDDSGEDDNVAETAGTALSKTEPGNADLPAEYELDSIVCHKGGSIHAG